MRLVAGLRPTRWGSLQRSPKPLSWVKGRRRGKGVRKGEGEGAGRGREEGVEKERGGPPNV